MICDEKSGYKSWSNLKKQMNDLLCDSLKDKISYFYTRYHEVHNAYGRATVNYCGKEIAAFSWVEMYQQEREADQLYREGKAVSCEELEKEKWMPECTLCEADFIHSITVFLKTDIAASLQSDNYLLRVFAFMDRRVGKRTLVKLMDEAETLPHWVKQFYLLRCEAEGIAFPAEQASSVHHMKLRPSPFEMIKNGEKTVELRLFDEKRQSVKVGDQIVFTNTETGETYTASVVNLHRFDSFEELYQSLPLLKCGYTAETVGSAHPSDMEQYYSAEEQAQYGVVGIELG